jgi:hypothetical protein
MSTLCTACGRAATHFATYDLDCQGRDPDHKQARCDDCPSVGDYEMCLVCMGHIDGNESASCKRCECFIDAMTEAPGLTV